MPPKVAHLLGKVRPRLRTPEKLMPVDVTMQWDEGVRSVIIDLPHGPEHDHKSPQPKMVIKVSEIIAVKARDYPEGNSLHYVLTVVLAANQLSLQFSHQEQRDHWHEGLRALIPNRNSFGSSEVKVPKSRYTNIVKVALQDPGESLVASIKVDLGNETQEILEVPRESASSDDIKLLTQEFVEMHSIFPSESSSLFRFVRAVVSRATMATEVAAIIEEINMQNFDELMKENGGKASVQEVLQCTKDNLMDLNEELEKRIGQQGPGALVVTQILRRNILKMKAVNELAARNYEAALGSELSSARDV